jgi:hypothetical protein
VEGLQAVVLSCLQAGNTNPATMFQPPERYAVEADTARVEPNKWHFFSLSLAVNLLQKSRDFWSAA